MQNKVSYISGSFNSLSFGDNFGNKSKVNVALEGQTVKATPRFWGSLSQLLKTNTSFPSEFKLFSAKECLERIKNKYNRELTFCVDNSGGELKLLGVNNAKDNLFDINKAYNFLEKRYGDVENIRYKNGIVSYTVNTNNKVKLFNSDDLIARKVLEIPIDNYKDPQVYTEFLRLVCLNGMRAQSKEFVKAIKFGNETYRLNEIFDSYERSKSFKTMEEMFNQSCRVQAVASELKSVMNVIKDAYGMSIDSDIEKEGFSPSYFIRRNILLKSGLRDSFNIYNVSDLDTLNKKQLDGLPTNFTGFDLINMLTELRTHVGVGDNLRKIDKKVGELLTKKDWILKDIELPSGVGIDFEKHSIHNFFSKEDRSKATSLYEINLQKSVKKEVKEVEKPVLV